MHCGRVALASQFLQEVYLVVDSFLHARRLEPPHHTVQGKRHCECWAQQSCRPSTVTPPHASNIACHDPFTHEAARLQLEQVAVVKGGILSEAVFEVERLLIAYHQYSHAISPTEFISNKAMDVEEAISDHGAMHERQRGQCLSPEDKDIIGVEDVFPKSFSEGHCGRQQLSVFIENDSRLSLQRFSEGKTLEFHTIRGLGERVNWIVEAVPRTQVR